MSSVLSKIAFGVWNMLAPKQGPKALPYTFVFSGAETITDDLLTENVRGDLQFVQSIYVDNTDNDAAFEIIFGVTNQRIVVPANAQGIWPVISPDQTRFEAALGIAGNVPVLFLNVPFPYTKWGPINVTGTVTPSTGNMIDYGLSTAGAVSEPLIPANAARLGFLIEALSTNTESVFVNFGAAAAADETSIEITPGGYLPSAFAYSKQAINVYSANPGQLVAAKEIV